MLIPLACAPALTDTRIADDYRLVGKVDFATALRRFYRNAGQGRNDRPVVGMTFALDRQFWGDRPVGYHLTNILLHTANTILLLLVLHRLTGNVLLAFVAAALFALSPVNHERIAWITARDGMVSTFFMFVAWLFFLIRRNPGAGSVSRQSDIQRQRIPWQRQVSWVAYLLALFSYEGAAILPVILFFQELQMNPREGAPQWRRTFLTVLPYLIILTAYVSWWFAVLRATPEGYGTALSLGGAAKNFYRLHYRLFFGVQHWFGLVYVLLAYLAWRQRRDAGALLLFSGTFIWICFLPFLFVAGFDDRFAYTSSAGAALFIAASVVSMLHSVGARTRATLFSALLILVFVGHFARSVERQFEWWIEAGRISETIPAQVKALHAQFPPSSTLLFEDIPARHGDAFVYANSFEIAVREKYRDEITRVVYSPERLSAADLQNVPEGQAVFWFHYSEKEGLAETGR